MNMFYTGIGIARSLGENGVPVIGLTSSNGIYGNYTRYAKIVRCPDSRNEPEALLEFLLAMGRRMNESFVIFPTRDDDVLFLDRFREELSAHFILTIPERPAVSACLNKWETYVAACEAGVPTPKSWLISEEQPLHAILHEITYPCVLKPAASFQWRRGGRWQAVGARKAIGIQSKEELLAEYATIERVEKEALVQEMIPGSDDRLLIAACYLDRDSKWVAGFNTRKLIQEPEGFGTGCVVQAADCPELTEPTARLLRHIGYTGIAEAEYKWDAAEKQYKLIEVNPRPWDQHRLGKTCGTDLVYLAYCEHAGLEMPPIKRVPSDARWIAEDTFITTALRMLWRRDPRFKDLLAAARGRRVYGIWSIRDPLPLLGYMALSFLPALAKDLFRRIGAAATQRQAHYRVSAAGKV